MSRKKKGFLQPYILLYDMPLFKENDSAPHLSVCNFHLTFRDEIDHGESRKYQNNLGHS